MRKKNILTAVLVIFSAVGLYFGYQQIQKYRALRSMTIDAVFECRENLRFLYEVESFMKEPVNETDAMIKAQWEIQRHLKRWAILGLVKAGIRGKKKEAAIRAADKIDRYNELLAYAFNSGTGGHGPYPEYAPGTGDLIKELLELQKMLGEDVKM